MKKRRTGRPQLFARWFWLVHVPLGLLLAFFFLFVTGLLPRAGIPALIFLAVWGLLALRLIFERRRQGLYIPPPKSFVIWVAAVTGLVLCGGILFWIGAGKLNTNTGVVMFVIGGFLMILSVTAPAFKLIDVGLRRFVRVIKKAVSRVG
jgi:hypothetical protein